MKVQFEIEVLPEQLEETLAAIKNEYEVVRVSHKQLKEKEEEKEEVAV